MECISLQETTFNFKVDTDTRALPNKTNNNNKNIRALMKFIKKLDASESKWVNSDDIQDGVNLLNLEGL